MTILSCNERNEELAEAIRRSEEIDAESERHAFVRLSDHIAALESKGREIRVLLAEIRALQTDTTKADQTNVNHLSRIKELEEELEGANVCIENLEGLLKEEKDWRQRAEYNISVMHDIDHRQHDTVRDLKKKNAKLERELMVRTHGQGEIEVLLTRRIDALLEEADGLRRDNEKLKEQFDTLNKFCDACVFELGKVREALDD